MSYKKIFVIAFGIAALLPDGAIAQSVSQTAPAPTGSLTAPGPQKHQPQQQRQPLPPGRTAPQPVLEAPGKGNVEGFVYWDALKIVHKPAGSCSGLAITVSVGTNSGGPLTAYTAIGTLNNNFKYVGQVKQFLAGGKVNVYDVCTYAFDHVPVGPSLQVKLDVTDPFAFSPYALPQSATLGPIQIISGQCNMLPRIVNPTASDLLGHWGTCQSMAYGVNFPMTIPARASLSGGGITPVNSGGQRGLLSGAPQQGMLSSGTTQSAQGQGNSGTLLGNRGSTAGQSSGIESPASKVELNPQPLPPRQISPGSSGLPGAANLGAGAGVPGNFVPKMPAMTSNPKRDASPPADEATKAQIRSKLQAQLTALLPRTAKQSNLAAKPRSSTVAEIQALQAQTLFVQSQRTQPTQTKGRLAPAPTQNLIAQASNPMLHAPQPLKICLAPTIQAVNGKASGVVFSQDPAYNDYIISGCGFGSQAGQLYLSGAITGGRINLVVKQWSDTQIEAAVQPGLSGVLDGWPDLIVAPVGNSLAKLPNCRFYAQRQSVLLPFLPQQHANLANVTVGDATHGFGTKYCPGPDLSHLFPCIAYNAGTPLDGITNGHDYRNSPSELVSNAVDRDGGQIDFNSGEDVYDLSSMAPGFEVDYATVRWYAWTSDVCEGWASDAFPKKPGDSVWYETEGHYEWYLKTKTKVVVDWGVDHCAWRWLGIFKVDDWYNSGYSLEVFVKGPIGVDPWTGHTVSTGRNFGVTRPQGIAQIH